MARKTGDSIPVGLKDVCKELVRVMGLGFHNYKVVEDWLALMFYAFQHDDENYLSVVDRYLNHKEKATGHFATATAALLKYMHETNEEALGPLYMEFAADFYKGQYFTPMSVARMMAGMMQNGLPEDAPFTVCDPTCGSGLGLIASAKEQTFKQNCNAFFFGQDIDLNCCRMTALNLMFFNLNGLVIWGNTLRNEIKDAWMTKRSLLLGGAIAHVDDLDALKEKLAPRIAETVTQPMEEPKQKPEALKIQKRQRQKEVKRERTLQVMQGSLF